MPFLYFVQDEWLVSVATLEVPARSEKNLPYRNAVPNACQNAALTSLKPGVIDVLNNEGQHPTALPFFAWRMEELLLYP